jgi:hypothetical protein
MSTKVKPPFLACVLAGHVLARDLVVASGFTEGSGTIVSDGSPACRHASASGGFAWAPGPCGFAGSFDGTAGLDAGTLAFLERYSISTGVRFTGSAGNNYHIVLSRGDYATTYTNFALFVRPYAPNAYDLGIYAKNATTSYQAYHRETTAWGPFDGAWHELGATWDGVQFKIFLDGLALSLSYASHGAGADGSQNLRIGRGSTDAYSKWVGQMDHVYVWGRALSAGQMRRVAREPYCFVGSRWPQMAVRVGEPTIREVAGAISCVSSGEGTATVSHALDRPTGAVWPAVTIDIETSWLREALLNGQTDTAYRLGTALTQGWFWMRRAGCTAIYRSVDADPCHAGFGSPVAVGEIADSRIRVVHVDPGPDATWCYVARRFNGCGQQDLTLGAAALARTGPDGQLAAPRPNPVLRLQVQRAGGGRLRLVWFYSSLDQAMPPQTFRVYGDNGTGQIDFVTVLAEVPYRGCGCYSHLTDSLPVGRYEFAVRAEDTVGGQGPPQPSVSGDIASSAPEAPVVVALENV